MIGKMTLKRFRRLEWKLYYAVRSTQTQLEYFTSGDVAIVVCHAKCRGRTDITYIVAGRRTASPAEAVRLFNQQQRGHRPGAAAAERSDPGSA
jgi:hypothetical protein